MPVKNVIFRETPILRRGSEMINMSPLQAINREYVLVSIIDMDNLPKLTE
jgi:hypothetical protein